MNTETILLLVTTIAGVIKSIVEMKKARAEAAKAKAEAARAEAESARAVEAENLLETTIKGVENVKSEDPDTGRRLIESIKKQTIERGIAEIYDEVVQEVIKGDSQLAPLTRKLSKTRMSQTFREDELK